MSNRKTQELNESIEPLTERGSEDGVDSFLEEEKKSVLGGGNRTKSGRPKSTVKSLRESIGFIATNKFGEGRRVMEDDDDATDNRISIK